MTSANSRSYVTGLVCCRLVHNECKDALCSLEASSEVCDVHISMKNTQRNVKCFFRMLQPQIWQLDVLLLFNYIFALVACFPPRCEKAIKVVSFSTARLSCMRVLCYAVQRKIFNVTIKAFLLRLNDQEVRPKTQTE